MIPKSLEDNHCTSGMAKFDEITEQAEQDKAAFEVEVKARKRVISIVGNIIEQNADEFAKVWVNNKDVLDKFNSMIEFYIEQEIKEDN